MYQGIPVHTWDSDSLTKHPGVDDIWHYWSTELGLYNCLSVNSLVISQACLGGDFLSSLSDRILDPTRSNIWWILLSTMFLGTFATSEQ